MASTPRVFISYARKDGEKFATALRKRLHEEEPEITLWQDRAEMEGGVGWWKQIEEALDQVKFLVIVLTPAALQSEMTRKEWRYARQRGVNIYPVKGLPNEEIDYQALPSWMRKAHFFDLEKEWETFVNYLKSDRQPPRVPFMAPERPPGFVQRPKEFEHLLRLLLDRSKENPVAITSALQGAGGFGKTTLAAALCHDERIMTAFDDGILWVTLAQQPNLLVLLTKCYEALTSEQPAFLDQQQASMKLAEKLENRNCLLVIDDVWRKSDLDPFFQGGSGCARLITTRKFDVISARKAQRVSVGKMKPTEATELLLQRLPTPPDNVMPFVRLARRLGHWPLLIKLATGALLSRLEWGDTVDHSLAYVNLALDKRGVTAFDEKDEEQRSASVKDTLEISLGLLEPGERQALTELAIFPEDTEIPLSTLACLWRLDEFDIEDRARKFADHALLDLDLGKGLISQHDEIRTYLGQELSDPTIIHSRLADAWGNSSKEALKLPLPPGEDWGEGLKDHRLALSFLNLPDSYAWRFLAYHLDKAERIKELRQLLLDWGWLKAKLAATDIDALMSDYAFLPDDSTLHLLQGGLCLSADVLLQAPEQLVAQLYARLRRGQSRELDVFIEQAEAILDAQPLRYLTQNLLPAGSSLMRRLRGHEGDVTGALVLADGRLLSWSEDKTLRLWSTYGSALGVLAGHEGEVTGALVLADGRLLSWSADKTLRLWSEYGSALGVLAGHEGTVYGALALANGRLLSWSNDRTLRLWSADGSALEVLAGHESPVRGALALANGRLLSWSDDQMLRLWAADGVYLRVLAGHKGKVNGALALTDGRLLSWSEDKTLRLWAADASDPKVLEEHGDPVRGALALADGRLLSWSDDHTLRLWAADGSYRRLLTIESTINGILALADGRFLSWGYETLKLWTADGTAIQLLAGHEGRVDGALALADGRFLSWTCGLTLRLWAADGSGLLGVLAGHEGRVTGALALTDGRLLSWSEDRTLRLWAADGSALFGLLEGHEGKISGALALADGRLLSWSEDKTLRLWAVDRMLGLWRPSWAADGSALAVLAGHKGKISGALDLANGWLLSWSEDQTLRLWAADGSYIRVLAGHEDKVNGGLALADGRLLSWSADKTLRLWAADGSALGVLAGHKGEVTGALALTDGRLLSWSEDRTLRLWAADGSALGVLAGHEGEVTGALALADGRLLSWSEDKTLRLWSAYGSALGVLAGCEGEDSGALALADGRLLSWSADGTLRLLATSGELLAVLYFEASITPIAQAPWALSFLIEDSFRRVHSIRVT